MSFLWLVSAASILSSSIVPLPLWLVIFYGWFLILNLCNSLVLNFIRFVVTYEIPSLPRNERQILYFIKGL